MLDTLLPEDEQTDGDAFNTADLVLLRGWCDFHGLSMGINLAGRVAHSHCDEVVVLTTPDGAGSWAMWRDQDEIALQAHAGVARRFPSVCDAMAALMPPPNDSPSDIRPSGW